MKVRGTIGGTPFSAKLTVLCWGALTLLVPVAVSACTSSLVPHDAQCYLLAVRDHGHRDGHGDLFLRCHDPVRRHLDARRDPDRDTCDAGSDRDADGHRAA